MTRADRPRTRLLELVEHEVKYHTDEGFPSGGSRASLFTLALRAERNPAARAYASIHQARWPETQTSWIKHLTELCEKGGGEFSRSKIRTVAKRLHLEQQTMKPHDFTLKHNAIIPDLDWAGGLPDKRLGDLPAHLSRLTGQGRRGPVRLFSFAEVEREFGLTHHELWSVVRRLELDLVTVGHEEFRIHEHDVLWLRELDTQHTSTQP